VVVRAAVFANGEEIGAEVLPAECTQLAFSAGIRQLAVLPELEKSAILKTMEEARGHQQTAATKLGISKRTLQRKLRAYRMVDEPNTSLAS
jgi:DNA-binding NtrC family response regulator